jgi:hypothetical protein
VTALPIEKRSPYLLSWAILVSATIAVPIPGFGFTSTLGAVLAIPLIPSVWRSLAGLNGGRFLIGAVGVALLATPLTIVVGLTVDPGRTFNYAESMKELVTFATLGLVCVGVYWSARQLGLAGSLALVGASTTAEALLFPRTTPDLLWKFGLCWTVPVLVLALLLRAPKFVQIAALIVLGYVAMTNDSRNNLAALALAAVLAVLAGGRKAGTPRQRPSRASALLAVGAVSLAAVALFQVLPQLALQGALGEGIQERQINQEDEAGFLGGRIEFGASWNIFIHSPLGIGAGVKPSPEDAAHGFDGLTAIGVRLSSAGYDAEYARDTVLAGYFELHSLVADLWLRFGLPGLVVSASVLVMLVRCLILLIANRRVHGIGLAGFAIGQSIWDVLFSPERPNGVWIFVTLGIALVVMTAPLTSGSAIATNGTRFGIDDLATDRRQGSWRTK